MHGVDAKVIEKTSGGVKKNSYLFDLLLTVAPIWMEAPFIRVLTPFAAGIILQWYYPIAVNMLLVSAGILLTVIVSSFFLKGYLFYKYKWISGVVMMLLLMILGMLILHWKNIKHQQSWFGNACTDSSIVIASLTEPLVEKNKSFKATAEVRALSENNGIKLTTGSIIIYFNKDSSIIGRLKFGSTILFKKPLQHIRNSGNPGAFDYSRYNLFQGITHQVYLRSVDFSIDSTSLQPRYLHWLQASKKFILDIVKKYIPGRQEAGVAEALLIGYRNDLDRDLVQQYSNTGVIHVIAISGMHLAMIYGLLILMFRPLQKSNRTKWVRGAVILAVLWSFSLLSGAGASILRSVVMFSFIVVGESMSRQVSVYHTLAASAFFLLCWNPFFLWDVGFQLSYAAVLSIVIFLKPVTNWFYFPNKIIDYVWKLAAVTIAAQILTTPLSIYHFHQVPNFFLLSNLFVVPLSGIVLYGEILLCLVSCIPFLAVATGKALSFLLGWMNDFTAWVNALPYAVSEGIVISALQTVLLYAFIILTAVWLMYKNIRMAAPALATLLLFTGFRFAELYSRAGKPRMIVYNLPGHTAVDFFDKGHYFYAGDDTVNNDDFMKSFYLSPARMLNHVKPGGTDRQAIKEYPFIWFNHKRILILNGSYGPFSGKAPDVDILILSGQVKSSVTSLWQQFRCSTYVFDGSCPSWKTRKWKNECDSLLLRRHSVEEDGAFILD